MGKIIELSQAVANQIAAGEVVERPASVIKELVENALDAKARDIEVRIKDGGFVHMVVQDDGVGMDVDDLRLAIKRYATSKLATVSDLNNIATFGFRGEALPSIASISNMTIMSRTSDLEVGAKALIEAGVLRDLFPLPAPFGTRIEVRDLFFNVPARLKFARSKRAEVSEIDRLLRSFAFAHHGVSLRLFVDNYLVFSSTKTNETISMERAVALLGQDTEGMLYEVEDKAGPIKVHGVVASPMTIRRDARGMMFFVNDRLIFDKKLVMAVKMAFQSLLEIGRSPVCALKISIDPDLVDVNVHPRKTEVRFQDERQVISHLISMLRNFLANTPWLSENKVSSPSHYLVDNSADGGLWPKTPSLGFIAAAPETMQFDKFVPAQKSLLAARKFSDLRVIGQVRATYLLAESHEGLVIIDQHAAHERIMYERIRQQQSINQQRSHPLLIPISISLSCAEIALLDEHRTDLQNLGIEMEIFGKDQMVVRTVPDFLQKTDLSALIHDIVNDFSFYGQSCTTEKLFSDLCATLACHGAIRAGQRMSHEEVRALLIELDETDFGAHCPHGRPIVKSLHESDLKKWFDRT